MGRGIVSVCEGEPRKKEERLGQRWDDEVSGSHPRGTKMSKLGLEVKEQSLEDPGHQHKPINHLYTPFPTLICLNPGQPLLSDCMVARSIGGGGREHHLSFLS